MARKRSKADRVCAWVLADQLNIGIESLRGLDPATTQVVMIESQEHLAGRPVHKQQLAFTLAAMRHFAQKLRALGWNIYYYAQQPNYNEPLLAHLREYKARHLIVMEPADHDTAQFIAGIPEWTRAKVEVRPNNLTLLPRKEFARWFRSHKRRGPADFYRFMRQRLKLLLGADGKPLDGTWPAAAAALPPRPAHFPPLRRFKPNFTTSEVLEFVRDNFAHYPGELLPFEWPVTKGQIHQWLTDFLQDRLPHFHAWREAMLAGQGLLYHSHLGAVLNAGLVSPDEVLQTVLQYQQSYPERVSQQALEAFLHGLVGAREYAIGLYAMTMPELKQANPLELRRGLPAVFRTGQTDMHCLADVLQRVLREGYASEPERRLVLANFGQLGDVQPAELAAWFAGTFVDGAEWAALPAIAGDSADGPGPAIAPGGEINRRSDFCGSCRYDPALTQGEKACPYNFLYWSFLERHRQSLAGLPRFKPAYRQLDHMDARQRRQTSRQAEQFLDLHQVLT